MIEKPPKQFHNVRSCSINCEETSIGGTFDRNGREVTVQYTQLGVFIVFWSVT